MGLLDPFYGAYERQLARSLDRTAMPRHVGVMLDGNRRWARENGFDTASGHQAGADKIKDLLAWCEEMGVEVVTLWLLSTDNLRRDTSELDALLTIIENAVAELAQAKRWRLRPVGALELLPEHTAISLRESAQATAVTAEGIAAHLYTKGQPDPDLVIRTSGEQRLGGFLLWQSAQAELYFCEAYWPDFRKVDFLRALRSYTTRERRFGT